MPNTTYGSLSDYEFPRRPRELGKRFMNSHGDCEN